MLSRQKDESIMIGDSVRITIVDVRGDKVRIGIEASKDIKIFRTEIYEEIQRQNKQAAAPQAQDVDRLKDLLG